MSIQTNHSLKPDQITWTEEKMENSIYRDQWLLYTTSDEDSESELKALQIKPSDTVVSITGSGCRSLSLLVDGPKKLISVDANPNQNFLLELKIAAIKELNHDECLSFLGIKQSGVSRKEVFYTLQHHLSPPAQKFWQTHLSKIEEGIIFLGKHEMFYKKYLGSLIFRVKRPQFEKLLECESIEEQRKFYEEKWNTPFWRWLVRTCSKKKFFEIFLGDPSYFNQVEDGFSIGDYMLSRFDQSFKEHLVRDNHFMTFLFCSKYMNEEALPVYIQKKHYETIKKNIDCVEIVTDRIDQFLTQCPNGVLDKYSLSDISGWIPKEEFEKILFHVERTMRNNGIVCFRNFLAKRDIPVSKFPSLSIQNEMMERLNKEDCAFAFTFQVAKKEVIQ
ncbi:MULTISPECIES: DUF3419 family protein [Metabacillus]|uniref:DUF3419 family protein n=2 Tax=Metabacillus TaxID=2675233 RepID=A0A179T2U8_9BACI|nr:MULTISPECIES: DUF3419 family protein [Metabacillus]OAS88285.1 hypothetical protein A6K24_16390 [Metabacillus litoralis]QNF28010.1 DUF3419 family protein [Metabacillus sp. KUDC1714]